MLEFIQIIGDYPVIIQHSAISAAKVFHPVPIIFEQYFYMAPGNNISVQFDIWFVLCGAATYHGDSFMQSKCFADILGIAAFHNEESQV
jgi:hypothetical protein